MLKIIKTKSQAKSQSQAKIDSCNPQAFSTHCLVLSEFDQYKSQAKIDSCNPQAFSTHCLVLSEFDQYKSQAITS